MIKENKNIIILAEPAKFEEKAEEFQKFHESLKEQGISLEIKKPLKSLRELYENETAKGVNKEIIFKKCGVYSTRFRRYMNNGLNVEEMEKEEYQRIKEYFKQDFTLLTPTKKEIERNRAIDYVIETLNEDQRSILPRYFINRDKKELFKALEEAGIKAELKTWRHLDEGTKTITEYLERKL